MRSEPAYIRGFERHVRAGAPVEIEIPRDQGDPQRVVEIAKEHRDKAVVAAKQEGDTFLLFDEVWCVFDRDEHPRFEQACEMARANGFDLAVSNPCFELWLLLHFTDKTGVLDHVAMQQRLKKELPGYDKTRLSFDAFRLGVSAAVDRARRLDKDAKAMGEPRRNPTTSFFRLTDSISREVRDASASTDET